MHSIQRISYAKTKSHAVAKADGTYVTPDRAQRSAHNKEQREKLENRKEKEAATMRQQQQHEQRQQMLLAGAERESMNAPHHILFVEALPKMATDEMVSTLFKQVRRARLTLRSIYWEHKHRGTTSRTHTMFSNPCRRD